MGGPGAGMLVSGIASARQAVRCGSSGAGGFTWSYGQQ